MSDSARKKKNIQFRGYIVMQKKKTEHERHTLVLILRSTTVTENLNSLNIVGIKSCLEIAQKECRIHELISLGPFQLSSSITNRCVEMLPSLRNIIPNIQNAPRVKGEYSGRSYYRSF
jgi:hypothetical protein